MRNLIFVIVALIACCCSCSNKVANNGLDEACRLLPSDPSAALDRLNGIDVTGLTDSTSLARWALLYSEAMVANNYKAPNDTIINIAIDYYGKHNSDLEYRHALSLKSLLNSAESDKLASALYLQKEREFMLYKAKAKLERTVLLSLILIFAALSVILWQRQRIKLRESQNEALMAEASGLRTDVSNLNTTCSTLESKLTESLDSRFSVIDELCETYYETQGTKAERNAIVDKVKSQIESMKSDVGLFKELEESVNNCKGNLLSNLKTEIHGMKPDDYRLIVYLASGLSNRSIALLLGEKIDVVYKRKSRLKAKVTALSSLRKEDFATIF